MFLKYTVIFLVLYCIFSVYLHEYHITTYTNLKFKLHDIADTLTETFSEMGYMKTIQADNKSGNSQTKRLYSLEELANCAGQNGSKKLYLAILGKVYDVGAGKKHYGPGEGYHFFTGRDATRAFVTGDFTDAGLTDDVSGLTPAELKSLVQWQEFYTKEYTYKGDLIGRYYHASGEKTSYNIGVEQMIEEAKENEATKSKDKLLFPPCNVEWSLEFGGRVWCTTMSGGIKRDWVGVPRQLYVPGSDSYRCACINNEITRPTNDAVNQAQLKEYPNCNPTSVSCKT